MRMLPALIVCSALAGCCPPMGSPEAIARGCCRETKVLASPGAEQGNASQPSLPGPEAGNASQPERPPPVPRRVAPQPTPPPRPPVAIPAEPPGGCKPCGSYTVGYTCSPDGRAVAFCSGIEGCLTLTPCPRGCQVASPDLPESDHCK